MKSASPNQPQEPKMAGRPLDELVADKVMGFHVERVMPEWNRGREVRLYFEPEYSLVQYSCDGDADNAMMYRNGVDEKDGIAPPLPAYSEEIAEAWTVVERMKRDGFRFQLFDQAEGEPGGAWLASFDHDEREIDENAHGNTAPLAICRAALRAAEERPERAPVPAVDKPKATSRSSPQ